MDRPQEIEVAEEHEIVERVAATGVAKTPGTVFTRVPHQRVAGRRVTKVWETKAATKATTKAITEFAERSMLSPSFAREEQMRHVRDLARAQRRYTDASELSGVCYKAPITRRGGSSRRALNVP